jgi:hypothetical protein
LILILQQNACQTKNNDKKAEKQKGKTGEELKSGKGGRIEKQQSIKITQ